eukprot:CFRG7622T1
MMSSDQMQQLAMQQQALQQQAVEQRANQQMALQQQLYLQQMQQGQPSVIQQQPQVQQVQHQVVQVRPVPPVQNKTQSKTKSARKRRSRTTSGDTSDVSIASVQNASQDRQRYQNESGTRANPIQVGRMNTSNGYQLSTSSYQSQGVSTQSLLQRQYMKMGHPPVPATQVLAPDEGRRNVMFLWKADQDTKVEIAGSWDGWKRRVQLQSDNWSHFVVLDLKCGEYEYKYIINGKWTHDVNKPKVDDKVGSFNNCFRI